MAKRETLNGRQKRATYVAVLIAEIGNLHLTIRNVASEVLAQFSVDLLPNIAIERENV